MPLVQNNTKRKMQAGEVALGFGVHHLRTAAAPALAAATGHDWLFLDNEHGSFSVSEIAQLCIASLPTGVTPLVRVCANAIDEATRALDNGALGIVMPHVDTAKEARRIAEAFRYPPQGRRSWGGPPAVYGFRPPAMAEAQKAINDEILTVVMIESPEAVKNAGDIAAVDGIDVLLIGTSDLSSELGIAGQMGHPKVVDAYRTVGAACRKHGKVLGMGGVYDEENASRYVGMGARFVLTGSDHSYVVMGANARSGFFLGLPRMAEESGKKQAGEGLRRTSWRSCTTSRSGSCVRVRSRWASGCIICAAARRRCWRVPHSTTTCSWIWSTAHSRCRRRRRSASPHCVPASHRSCASAPARSMKRRGCWTMARWASWCRMWTPSSRRSA